MCLKRLVIAYLSDRQDKYAAGHAPHQCIVLMLCCLKAVIAEHQSLYKAAQPGQSEAAGSDAACSRRCSLVGALTICTSPCGSCTPGRLLLRSSSGGGGGGRGLCPSRPVLKGGRGDKRPGVPERTPAGRLGRLGRGSNESSARVIECRGGPRVCIGTAEVPASIMSGKKEAAVGASLMMGATCMHL